MRICTHVCLYFNIPTTICLNTGSKRSSEPRAQSRNHGCSRFADVHLKLGLSTQQKLAVCGIVPLHLQLLGPLHRVEAYQHFLTSEYPVIPPVSTLPRQHILTRIKFLPRMQHLFQQEGSAVQQ